MEMWSVTITKNKDINLLYAYEENLKKGPSFRLNTIAAFIVEFLVLIGVTIYIIMTASGLKAENSSIQSKIDSYKDVEKKIGDYNKIQGVYKDKKYIYDEILKENRNMLDAINTLENIMPEDMSMESMSLNKKNIAFIVKFSKEETLAEFINRMQGTEYFNNITLNGITSSDGMKKTSINAEIAGK